jgi:hypothetical protein
MVRFASIVLLQILSKTLISYIFFLNAILLLSNDVRSFVSWSRCDNDVRSFVSWSRCDNDVRSFVSWSRCDNDADTLLYRQYINVDYLPSDGTYYLPKRGGINFWTTWKDFFFPSMIHFDIIFFF